MADTAAANGNGWSANRRRLVSVLLLVHLYAVISAPLADPPPASGLSQILSKPVKWYLHAVYLNHGYRYFNVVGSTSVVRYEIVMPDGTTQEHRLSDRFRDWPRLLYHRHLMLGETLYREGDLPAEADFRRMVDEMRQSVEGMRRSGRIRMAEQLAEEIDRNIRRVQFARRRQQLLVHALAQYLLRRHGARQIRIYVLAHRIPTPEEIETGTRLGDESLYEKRFVGEFQSQP